MKYWKQILFNITDKAKASLHYHSLAKIFGKDMRNMKWKAQEFTFAYNMIIHKPSLRKFTDTLSTLIRGLNNILS